MQQKLSCPLPEKKQEPRRQALSNAITSRNAFAFLTAVDIEWSRWAAIPAALIFAWSYWLFGMTGGLVATSLIVVSLLAHELGHILVAAANRVAVMALGFSGVGTYIRRKQSESYRSEFLISSAGPVASFVLATVFWFAGGVIGDFLWNINLVIALSNLVPVRGTDGSRAFDAACKFLNSIHSSGK